MKRYALILIAVVAVTGGLIGLVALRPVAPSAAPPPIIKPQTHDQVATTPTTPPVAAAAPEKPAAPRPAETSPRPALIADKEAAKTRISRLVDTFDEAQLPELTGYLRHDSAEVRAAVIRGLLLLDQTAAVPYLRTAAEQADKRNDPIEANSLREAAEILASPRQPGEQKMPKLPLTEGAPISKGMNAVAGLKQDSTP